MKKRIRITFSDCLLIILCLCFFTYERLEWMFFHSFRVLGYYGECCEAFVFFWVNWVCFLKFCDIFEWNLSSWILKKFLRPNPPPKSLVQIPYNFFWTRTTMRDAADLNQKVRNTNIPFLMDVNLVNYISSYKSKLEFLHLWRSKFLFLKFILLWLPYFLHIIYSLPL